MHMYDRKNPHNFWPKNDTRINKGGHEWTNLAKFKIINIEINNWLLTTTVKVSVANWSFVSLNYPIYLIVRIAGTFTSQALVNWKLEQALHSKFWGALPLTLNYIWHEYAIIPVLD